MSMRNSLFQLVKGEVPSKAIWTADLWYWIYAMQCKGKGDPTWLEEEGYLRLCREMKIMPYYWYANLWVFRERFENVNRVCENQGHRKLRILRTPVGELREESVVLPESFTEAPTKYFVETVEDLKVLLYILEHRTLEPDNLEDYEKRLDLWARYDGVPSLGMPRSPLPAFFTEWAGVLNGAYLLFDQADLVLEVFRLLEEQESPIVDAVCEYGPPLIHFPDNLTSDNYTSLFDRYMAESYRRRLARLHEAGVSCAVHLDGTIRGLLPKLAAVGIDMVESLTPQPVGDVALEEMRSVAASDTLVLWGGVPGAMFAYPYTWPMMKKHVEKLLASWGETPFIVGVADQVPPDGVISMCGKIGDLIQNWSPRS